MKSITLSRRVVVSLAAVLILALVAALILIQGQSAHAVNQKETKMTSLTAVQSSAADGNRITVRWKLSQKCGNGLYVVEMNGTRHATVKILNTTEGDHTFHIGDKHAVGETVEIALMPQLGVQYGIVKTAKITAAN